MAHYPPDILNSFAELPPGVRLAVFGAGETGQEFARRLVSVRPDARVECFIDSYRSGVCEGRPVVRPDAIPALEPEVQLVIASVFWNEIADIVQTRSDRRCMMLSNGLINECSHLSAFGSFCFEPDAVADFAGRAAVVTERFRTAKDRDNYRAILDLRCSGNEAAFYEYADVLTRSQRKSFDAQDKYSQHLDFASVTYAIEGGVYDGQDTFLFMEQLKRASGFRQLYAFDPFLDALRAGPYLARMNEGTCEFIESVLWDCEETVGFRVDRANPANSRVLREAEIAREGFADKTFSTISIDTFLQQRGTRVDLVKLDVEGAEMTVLRGARRSIAKWRPQMAVSVYHRKEDLLDVPEYLLAIHPDYRFSLSMNGPTFVDMVLYAS